MTARQTLGGLALPLVVGLLAFSGPAPAKEHWATYLNPRFGAAADYPAGPLHRKGCAGGD